MTSAIGRISCAMLALTVTTLSASAQTTPPPGLNSNLALWLKADAGTNTTTDGAAVTSWADQSGHAITLTAVGAGAPIFDADGNGSLPAIRFNGAQFIGTNLGRVFTDATIFVVARQAAQTSNDNYIYSLGSTGAGRMFTLARGTAANTPGHTESYHWNGSREHLGACIPFGMYNVFSQVYHSAATGAPFHTLWIDGVNANVQTATSAYSLTTGALRLGNYVSGSFYHEGDITEFLIYDRALNDAERQSVETYLASRIDAAPRCPCDWNRCDGLNSQDFFDFLVDFFAADSDFNHSGATDSQDFFDYLVCFFSGCP